MENLAKEKAKELVDKFISHAYHSGNEKQCFQHAKQCALIAVDEILESDNGCSMYMHDIGVSIFVNFWDDVKTEINKL